ncbi:hypothetical protein QBC34DRAFT_406056, partial [Podospora aff. communis PSN243]
MAFSSGNACKSCRLASPHQPLITSALPFFLAQQQQPLPQYTCNSTLARNDTPTRSPLTTSSNTIRPHRTPVLPTMLRKYIPSPNPRGRSIPTHDELLRRRNGFGYRRNLWNQADKKCKNTTHKAAKGEPEGTRKKVRAELGYYLERRKRFHGYTRQPIPLQEKKKPVNMVEQAMAATKQQGCVSRFGPGVLGGGVLAALAKKGVTTRAMGGKYSPESMWGRLGRDVSEAVLDCTHGLFGWVGGPVTAVTIPRGRVVMAGNLGEEDDEPDWEEKMGALKEQIRALEEKMRVSKEAMRAVEERMRTFEEVVRQASEEERPSHEEIFLGPDEESDEESDEEGVAVGDEGEESKHPEDVVVNNGEEKSRKRKTRDEEEDPGPKKKKQRLQETIEENTGDGKAANLDAIGKQLGSVMAKKLRGALWKAVKETMKGFG